MPSPTKRPKEDPDNVGASILAHEKWLSINKPILESEGTVGAAIEIASVSSDIYRLKRQFYSAKAIMADTVKNANEYEKLSMESDRHCREWEQQKTRMMGQRNGDLLLRVIDTLDTWQKQGSTFTEVNENPDAPVIPKGA